MKHSVLLAVLLIVAACTRSPVATAPPMESAAPATASVPQATAEVRDAQVQLRAIGMYDGVVDGIYGQDTQSAVERFQRNRGLPVTARLDSATTAALRDEAARSAEPLPLSDPTHVRTVQNRLRQLGYYDRAADGVWGPATQEALEHFQRARRLPVGHVTRPTLMAMDLDPGDFTTPAAAGPGLREPLDPVVVRGVQHRLRELGFYRGAVDGKWGPATQEALEGFQRSRGLDASGGLNPTTASALGLDPNNLSGSAATIVGSPPGAR